MKYVIWDCNHGYSEESLQYFREEYPEYSEEEILDMSIDSNLENLDDERANLNIVLDNPIVAIAKLGTWNGPRKGYKMIGDNIAQCLYSKYEPMWYVDENGDLRCREAHHDGVNSILYREFKPSVSETQRNTFLNKVYSGTVTQNDISRYTRRIGDRIAQVYGWKVKNYTRKEA